MKASAYLKCLVLSAAAGLLAACGGGGSSDSDSGFTPQGIRVTATAQSVTIASGATTDIVVRVTEANGAPIREGTAVSASVSPAANGTIEGIAASGASTGGQSTTVGGNANFRFSGAGPGGAATLTFSVADPNAPARTVTATIAVNVTPPVDTSLRVTVEPIATSIPSLGVTDVVVRVRRANGTPVADGTAVNGVVTPGSAGTLVALNGNTTTGGIVNFRFFAGETAQVAQLVFSVTDATQNNQLVTGSASITITSGSGFLRVTVEPVSSSIPALGVTDVVVRVRRADGTAVANGTAVNGLVIPGSAGTLTSPTGNTTSGGVVNFRFFAGETPQVAQLSFSVTDTTQNNQLITGLAAITITSGSGFLRVIVEPAASTVPIQSVSDVVVRVRRANGSPVPDGTTVTGLVTPGSAGSVVGLPAATGPTATTTGGVANFRFLAGNSAQVARLIFSAVDTEQSNAVITGSATITVAGVDTARLRIEATTTTLPINAFNVAPFLGSPFMAEVTVTVRTASGQAVNLPDGIQVSVNPVGNTGGFTTLDDPTTTDINEFLSRLGQGPVDVVAGKATLFFHSLNFSGTSTLTVTFQDPENQQVIVATQVFTIVSAISNLPAAVSISSPLSPVYVQGSGGNTSSQLEILVRDGIGQPVPNPVSGNNAFNNVRIELLGNTNAGGTRLSGVNAQGQNVQGTQIALRTVSGISGVLLTSGTQTGSALIRVTADRADNNVDNGISDPVVAERSVFISDGVLFDLEITQPFVNAILINPVDPTVVVVPGQPTIPPLPDGTYSITVGVIATDRLGNPVIPGTAINFGLIDEPQATGSGDFLIAGTDGNPQENGVLFTAPGGAFTTAGGGVGPGDAVVILSEDDPANRDLEGARVVQSVNGPTSLTVQRAFNRNDVTGSTFDAGNVLDYVIGRAADGNITANAVTNELGVARTTLNYPVSRVGKFALVWAQGNGAIVSGQARTVADAEFLRFAGVAPATLTVSPSSIPGNTTTPVTICIRDALNVPIESVQVGFAFAGLTGPQGTVDGQTGSGVVSALTGRNGCAVASVTTTGVTQSGGTVIFSAVGQTGTVTIEVGTLILTANPPSLLGGGAVITLRLVDAGGNPVPGVQLTGACTSAGGATVSTEPANGTTGVTNANGEAPFSIFTNNLNQANGAGSGSCLYQVPGGTPNVTVPVQGIDLCLAPTSPPAPGCAAAQSFTLAIAIQGSVGQISSSPPGIACTAPVASCSATFAPGTTVSLLATAGPGVVVRPVFSGECGPPSSGSDGPPASATATVQMTQTPRICQVVFSP